MNSIANRQNKTKNNPMPDKTLKVLANSIYQTLQDEGCQHKDIIGVSSQLLGLVAAKIQAQNPKE